MVSGDILSTYFRWLLDTIYDEEYAVGSVKLLKQLFAIDFRYQISFDHNRVGDGLYLRETFSYETGIDCSFDRPCSVLEVLIGLSKRLAQDVIGDSEGVGLTGKVFWMFLKNLGLTNYLGARYDRNEVIFIVETWIGRDFSYDGSGSPFPLKFPEEDQRKCEIWQQVMNYLVENPNVEEGDF